MASLAISADFYGLLLYLIHRFSCPFYSSAVSCPLLIYCRSEPAGTQWGLSPREAVWHWSRLGARAALSELVLLQVALPSNGSLHGENSIWDFSFKRGEKKKCAQLSSLLSLSSPFTYETFQLMNRIFRIYMKTKYSWHLTHQNSFLFTWVGRAKISLVLHTAIFITQYIVFDI